MKRRTLITAFATGTLVLAACGGDHNTHTTDSMTDGMTAATSGIPADADFNDADVYFAQSMIPHHQQAVEMADIALDPSVGAGEQVLDLATRIQGAQDPEIDLMTGWLTAWGQPSMDEMPDHDMSSMKGMMSADEMDEMATMTGAEFDTMWMEMMIRHHEGAVDMALTVTTDGKNPDVKVLADAIVIAQKSEITEMQALLAG